MNTYYAGLTDEQKQEYINRQCEINRKARQTAPTEEIFARMDWRKLGKANLNVRTGYIEVHFKQKTYQQHRLVYIEAFGPIPANLEINHIQAGNKTDNRIENLELVTHIENLRHYQRNRSSYPTFQRVQNRRNQVGKLRKEGKTYSAISKELNTNQNTIASDIRKLGLCNN